MIPHKAYAVFNCGDLLDVFLHEADAEAFAIVYLNVAGHL